MSDIKNNITASAFAQKQRNLVSHREKKLERLNKDYDKRESQAKLDHMVQLDDMKASTEKKRLEKIIHQEDVLNTLKNDFSTKQDSLDKEKKKLQAEFDKNAELLKLNNESDLRNIRIRHQNNIEDENFNLQTSRQKTELKNTTGLSDQKLKFNEEFNNLQRFQTETFQNEKQNFRQKLNTNQLRFKMALDSQQNEFLTTESKNRKKYDKGIKDLKAQNEKEYNYYINKHKNIMEQTKKDFIFKFKNLVESQTKMYQNIKELSQKRIQDIRNSTSKEIELNKTKKLDEFYKNTSIAPDITTEEGKFIFKFKIPEHERGLINLSPVKNKVRITFTRNHKEDFRDVKGDYSKTQRSESIMKEVTLPRHMDNKSVEKSYKDGVVTFTVKYV